MLQVAHEELNPILNQHNCPVMNVRIGKDNNTEWVGHSP
jgi:hypothetical protein